jgi:transcriptional regulator with XRE-family HTH domain
MSEGGGFAGVAAPRDVPRSGDGVPRRYKKTPAGFRRLLRERGMTVARLAVLIGSCRCHVNKVLLGEAGRGFYTRRKLLKVLTAGEVEALGWAGAEAETSNFKLQTSGKHQASGGEKEHFHVEQVTD